MHPIASNPQRLRIFFAVWIPASLGMTLAPYAYAGGAWDEAWPLGIWAIALAGPALATWYISSGWPRTLDTGATLAAAAVSALVAAALWLGAGQLWVSLLGTITPSPQALFPELAPVWFALGTSALLVMLAIHAALAASEQERLSARHALQADLSARDAELRALRAQVNPHFLFNCLNSISALTTADPAAARRMCLALADFFRDVLRAGGKSRIHLGAEAGLAQQYLAIERMRFGERLEVVTQLDDAAADASVPPLLLQPLVENAVVHGIATVLEGGTIRIEARRMETRIQVTVSNPYDAESGHRGLGIGLSNVRARLEAAWPDESTVRIAATATEFSVTVTFPQEVLT